MGCFLSGIGVLAIIAGALSVTNGPTVLQEIEGVLCLGFGFVIIGLGGVVSAINDVSSILKTRLPSPQEPVVRRLLGWRKKSNAQAEGIKAVDDALGDDLDRSW